MVKEPLSEGCFKLESDNVLVLFWESCRFDLVMHVVDVFAKILEVSVSIV